MDKNYYIEIPEDIIRTLGISEKDVNSAVKAELAVYLFEKKRLSFGQARRLSGLSIWDFMELLQRREVPLRYDIAELEQDLKMLKDI